jgi:hypothetical protein
LATAVIFSLRFLGRPHFLQSGFLAPFPPAALFTLAQDEVTGPNWWVVGLLYLVATAVLIFVLLRLGLVATIAAAFFINAVNAMPLGTDWSAWYMPASIATLLLLVGISVFAFWRSLGGRGLIAEEDA